MSIAHNNHDHKQTVTALKARVSMLKNKLDSLHTQQKELESALLKQPQQKTVLEPRITAVKNEIESLKKDLLVSETSLKPLLTIN